MSILKFVFLVGFEVGEMFVGRKFRVACLKFNIYIASEV